jgi:hypothetical protein
LSARQAAPGTPVPTPGGVAWDRALNTQPRVPFQFSQVAELGQSALLLHFLTQMPAIRPPTVVSWPGPLPVTPPDTCAVPSVRLLSVQQTPPTPHTVSPSPLLQATLQKPGDAPVDAQLLLAQPLAAVVDGVQSPYRLLGADGTQTPLVHVEPVRQPPPQVASTHVRRTLSQKRPAPPQASAPDPQSGRQAPTAFPLDVSTPRKLHDEPAAQAVAAASPHFGTQLMRAPSLMQMPEPLSQSANAVAELQVCRQIGWPYSRAQ